MYSNDEQVMNRLREHVNAVDALGYEWVAVCLQGSQNYNLAYENSDVDSKAIVLPKFESFVLNKAPVSFTHEMENKEHVDIKDIRLMFECFKKQNINFVEILFSKYVIVNPNYAKLFQPMFDNREAIAHYNNYATVNCMVGTIMEKRKALCHPYPTIKWKIDKWGYDGKQLSHILRVNEFVERYIDGVSYSDCLFPSEESRAMQMKAKKNEFSLEEAIALADEYTQKSKDTKNKYMEENAVVINASAKKVMDDVLIAILKKSFSEQLKNADDIELAHVLG